MLRAECASISQRTAHVKMFRDWTGRARQVARWYAPESCARQANLLGPAPLEPVFSEQELAIAQMKLVHGWAMSS